MRWRRPTARANLKIHSRLVCAAALMFVLGEAAGQAHQPPKVDADSYVWEHTENPYSGDPEAIAEGQRLYRSTCYICHADTGARGPNLRKSKLKGQAFLKIVIHGRKGTQMPAWKGKLTEAEMWKVYSFIEAPPPAP
jgi:mono/diheme cytochrome c family protein